jgi:hypothetical protein
VGECTLSDMCPVSAEQRKELGEVGIVMCGCQVLWEHAPLAVDPCDWNAKCRGAYDILGDRIADMENVRGGESEQFQRGGEHLWSWLVGASVLAGHHVRETSGETAAGKGCVEIVTVDVGDDARGDGAGEQEQGIGVDLWPLPIGELLGQQDIRLCCGSQPSDGRGEGTTSDVALGAKAGP